MLRPHERKTMTVLTENPISVDYPELTEVKALTDLIRNHQRAIEEISKSRKAVILSLRRKRITYREIAAAMCVTEQSVYKILRESIKEQRNK
jgi:DNA-directed RNA polymerase specialized sigma24 family protein